MLKVDVEHKEGALNVDLHLIEIKLQLKICVEHEVSGLLQVRNLVNRHHIDVGQQEILKFILLDTLLMAMRHY